MFHSKIDEYEENKEVIENLEKLLKEKRSLAEKFRQQAKEDYILRRGNTKPR